MAQAQKSTPAKNIRNESKRRKLLVLRQMLELERSSFMSDWRELTYNCQARRARFTVSDVNRGGRRNNNIINNKAITSHRTLRAGMMAGMTSPARPWFQLIIRDPKLKKNPAVKTWLDEVTREMHDIYQRSNLYKNLPIVYGDMGQVATAAMLVEEDFDDVIRCYAFPVGSYMIAVNDKGIVDTFCRDFRYTVKQVVEKFGRRRDINGKILNPKDPFDIDWSNISKTVKNYWENNQREVWVDLVQMILPNDQYQEDRWEAQYKEFESIYFERGIAANQVYDFTSSDDELFLKISGYDYFPVLCPRWEVAAEDAYGTSCPGMDALGDVKALQVLEKRKLQAVDKIVNPPMIAPTSMRNAKTSMLPGDVSYADLREGQVGFQPVYQPKLSIQEVEITIEKHEARIDRAYYTDLFLMFANEQGGEPDTATEVNEKKQEKLLALGPVLEQTDQDLLNPLVEITFMLGNRQRRFPPPPQEIQGAQLGIEYLSIMAQAQKAAGLAGVERFMNDMSQQAEAFPEVRDKIDIDQYAEIVGDMTSVPPQLIRSADQVAQIRQSRAKAQQQQQQAEQAVQRTQAAKNLSGASLDGNNALSMLVDQSKAGEIIPS